MIGIQIPQTVTPEYLGSAVRIVDDTPALNLAGGDILTVQSAERVSAEGLYLCKSGDVVRMAHTFSDGLVAVIRSDGTRMEITTIEADQMVAGRVMIVSRAIVASARFASAN